MIPDSLNKNFINLKKKDENEKKCYQLGGINVPTVTNLTKAERYVPDVNLKQLYTYVYH